MGLALRSSEALTSPPRRHLTAVPHHGEGFGLPSRGASVLVLHPPVDSGPAAPLRLTRRGVFVVSVAVTLVGAALLWLAAASAPRPGAAGATHPRVVTVRTGDTLWAIATRLAPDADPGAEVAVLQRVNHLVGVQLRPGQRLRTG
jgi:hypothetical protein